MTVSGNAWLLVNNVCVVWMGGRVLKRVQLMPRHMAVYVLVTDTTVLLVMRVKPLDVMPDIHIVLDTVRYIL